MRNRIFGLAAAAGLIAIFSIACSSSSSGTTTTSTSTGTTTKSSTVTKASTDTGTGATTDTTAKTDTGTGANTDTGTGATNTGTGTGTGTGAAGGCTAPATCPPPAINPPFAAPAWASGACTDQEISDFLAITTQAAWTSYLSAHKACAACMWPQAVDKAATAWGPITPTGMLNIPGCAEHYHAGCGAPLENLWNCEDGACSSETGGNCETASDTEMNKCLNDSEAGCCKSFVDPVNAACDPGDAAVDPTAVCMPLDYADGGSEDSATFQLRFIKMFCGK